jgi:uncharacterized membrane protein YfcA
MAGVQMLWLMVIFFLTSAVSVARGSTSLITVPAMLQFHIEPRIGLATNMFALTFMSVGRTLPFLRSPDLNRRRLSRLVGLTLLGSVLGAFLLLCVPTRSVPMIVSTAVIGVAVFSVAYRKSGVQDSIIAPSSGAEAAGYALTFLLGIYGGFFSGGYVTILTAFYVAAFRFTFVEAIATLQTHEFPLFSQRFRRVHVARVGQLSTRSDLWRNHVCWGAGRFAIRAWAISGCGASFSLLYERWD